jgi:hypothetical protein
MPPFVATHDGKEIHILVVCRVVSCINPCKSIAMFSKEAPLVLSLDTQDKSFRSKPGASGHRVSTTLEGKQAIFVS